MHPLLILLIGMVVVVGSVLVLRLHAFLALIGGALVVALLTTQATLQRYALRDHAMEIASINRDGSVVIKTKGALLEDAPLLVLRSGPKGHAQAGVARVMKGSTDKSATIRPAPDGVIQKGDVIVEPSAMNAVKKLTGQSLGDRIATGFGDTCLSIGILIAMAAIVGETLLTSGAAEKIVASSRNALGDKNAGLAFLISGFILGIPVFFDTVFYLLIPLGKVMRVRSGRDYTLYVLCIVAGATMTHSLVPPTPGPLFVAAALNVDLATMILGGLMVGAITAGSGYAYALWANRKWDIPVPAELMAREEEGGEARVMKLPPLWLSLLPILLPVVLISLSAFLSAVKSELGGFSRVIHALGDKNISLSIAAAIGLLMVVWQKRGDGKVLAKNVGEALASAGVIILVTSAGGAFGHTLRQTDIAAAIRDSLPLTQHTMIPLAFFAAAIIRTAQGSATVAMITAAGIISPLVAAGGLPFHAVYLALAIGCGSKPFMWMNDSGFWIIGKMSGFTEAQTLRTASVMMLIMGFVGLVVVMIGAWLFPLV